MGQVLCKCGCGTWFTPKRAGHVYYDRAHRARAHRRRQKANGGIPVRIASLRNLKNGGVSITAHVAPENAAEARQLEPETAAWLMAD